MTDIIGYILITIGIFFDISGCIGLVRFPDVYNRLQASTKCVTLGTILLLIGVAVESGQPVIITKALMCVVFILLTSPTAAHAISKGAHSSGVSLWENSVVDKYAEDK
ncbi:MAG: monovalent cation/H(+) antiporter subunit G [Planctomycetota bacterium]|jgi:multicomponent Na+:H+ antiporter subunit G